MCRSFVIFVLMFIFFERISYSVGLSRQKRCIVIQKQSGTHGDSTEGEDERLDEERKTQDHHNNNNWRPKHNRHDAEVLSPEFLRYQAGKSKKINDLIRLRNKLNSYKRL